MIQLLNVGGVSSEEIILSYSSSPKETVVVLPQCLVPNRGIALKIEIEDPAEDGGGEAEDTKDKYTEEEKGSMVFTVLISPGAIYTHQINVSGQSKKEIPLCFEPKPIDLANIKSAKISATSDLVNDRNIKMSFVSYQCERHPLEIENKKLKLKNKILGREKESTTQKFSTTIIASGISIAILGIALIISVFFIQYHRKLYRDRKGTWAKRPIFT